MEIDRNPKTYEGIPLVPGMMMALMEDSGVRELIDRRCRPYDPSRRELTHGMAAKAIIGTMFEKGKTPLYCVENFYATAPCDLLFGEGVGNDSLSDTNLASRIDIIHASDTVALIDEAYVLITGKLGLERGYCQFIDATNYTMYGEKYVLRELEYEDMLAEKGIYIREAPVPKYGGNAKDKRNDLVQLNIHTVTDSNGVLKYSRSYSGNVSDIEMNRDTVKHLISRTDVEESIIIADSKLYTADLLKTMISSGMLFITKVPLNFNGKLHERMERSVLLGGLDESNRKGRMVFDTAEDVEGSECRVIAYALDSSRRDSEAFIRGKGLESMRKALVSLKRRRFFCEDDALSAFREVIGGGFADAYAASPEVYVDERLRKSTPDGPFFRVCAKDLRIDESKMGSAVNMHALQVLITNIPFSKEHSEDIRRCGSADDVIELYLEQAKEEANFKMMKSGMAIGDVYIHTPARISAVAALVSLATMMSSAVNAKLRQERQKGERRMTVKRFRDLNVRGLLWYNRRKDTLSVTGGNGTAKMFFEYFDRLGIDPQMLLGHR